MMKQTLILLGLSACAFANTSIRTRLGQVKRHTLAQQDDEGAVAEVVQVAEPAVVTSHAVLHTIDEAAVSGSAAKGCKLAGIATPGSVPILS